MKLLIPDYAKNAINNLIEKGYSAYFVGGGVRDALLGKIPEDWDIATNATPQEVCDCFPKHFETGIKHGTITILQDGFPVEITTFRIDGGYEDNRHPEEVMFASTFKEDVKRRDFTINSIGYNETDGVVDYEGGLSDLNAKIIRCVGDPDTRFNEDALRILRAVRFSAVLDFEIEENTYKAVLKNKHLLKNISAERVQKELEKMFLSGCTLKPLIPLLDVLIPELNVCFDCQQNNPYHVYNVGEHCIKAAEVVAPDKSLKYAALLHDIGKPTVASIDENGVSHFYSHALFSEEIARDILNRLKLDNKTKNEVLMLIKYHDRVFDLTEKSIRKFLSKTSPEFFKKLLKLQRADVMSQNPSIVKERLLRLLQVEEILEKVIESEDAFSLKDLAVNGRDIMELGAQNSQIRFILNRLLTAVIDNQQLNDREKLLEMAKNIIKCR